MLNIKPGTASQVFVKYRKDLDEILNVSLVPFIHDAFKTEINSRTDNELISDQVGFQDAIEARLAQELGSENFLVQKVTTGIVYPKALTDAIMAKNKAIQDQARVENEILVAQKEAEKMLITARAEKEANELKTKGLTPAILEQMWIEKWNGSLPQYGTVPTLFKDITK
jgi:regulator of protease activity HflC (stomatin/prohibitin superfamily)